jgi:hypothetical protein
MQIDWNSVLFPSLGIAEAIVRGSLMCLGLFLIMRFMARRQTGHFGRRIFSFSFVISSCFLATRAGSIASSPNEVSSHSAKRRSTWSR